MADAKKCDRCGNFYVKNNDPAYVITYFNRLTHFTKDLCPDCEKKLKEWFEGFDHDSTEVSSDS
jgi:hypothetical protein